MRSELDLVRRSLFSLIILTMVVFATPGSSAAERAGSSAMVEKLQLVVADLKERLELPAPVVVSIVPSNKLMMSVEAPSDENGPFLLSIDASFLTTLSDDEIEAAIAHELGHVWVFTHHPYLQTEELANQIAMRAVTRESLERMYGKVWGRGGMKGDLARFLGPAPETLQATESNAR
ncbi:MAG TPA: hypothetical protein VFS23_37525 [Vicinamibacterales bacterium]|nr:hypothetical protein [Vicinamibacterales bacterium]